MLTLIRCLFHPRTPSVTAVARKRPQSFCQKCRWQVIPKHAYTLESTKSERADYADYLGLVWEPTRKNELTRNSSGNTRPQSFQLAEPLWTDPGLKKWNCYTRAPLKKTTTKNRWLGMLIVKPSPKTPRKQRKRHRC